MNRTLAALTILAPMVAIAGSAHAARYTVEVVQSKETTIETIGRVPPKRFIKLELGNLRTRPAMLPGGTLSLEDRMRLRAERALARQKAVSNARRDWGPSKPSSTSGGSGGSNLPPLEENLPPQGVTIE